MRQTRTFLLLLATSLLIGIVVLSFRHSIRYFWIKNSLEDRRVETRKVKALDTRSVELLLFGNSFIHNPCVQQSEWRKVGMWGEIIEGIEDWADDLNKAERLVIWIGLNNILNGQSGVEAIEQLHKMIPLIESNIELIIIEIPEISLSENGIFASNDRCNPEIQIFNESLGDLVSAFPERSIEIVQLNSVPIFNEGDFHLVDGVHLKCEVNMAVLQTAVELSMKE